MPLNQKEREIFGNVVRQVLYFILTGVFVIFVWWLAHHYRSVTFIEYGILENIQLIMLLISGGIFIAEACILKRDAPLFLVFGSLCFLAGCRELDSFFDAHLPIISWKFAFIFPILAGIYFCRHWRQIRGALFYFMGSSAFYLMNTAVIVGVLIAHCFGHRPMIIDALNKACDARLVRRMVEEGLEAIGYFLILLSTVEAYLVLSKRK